MAKEIFISYSRIDYQKVINIKREIDEELGVDCWMDLNRIESSSIFEETIIDSINKHSIMIFMLSQNSQQSEWALKELSYAEKKEKHIILINIDHCSLSDTFLFRYSRHDINDFENKLQKMQLFKTLMNWLNIYPASVVDNWLNSAYNLYKEKQYRNAFDIYLKLAQKGNRTAQYFTGLLYKNGQGVEKDYQKCAYWYMKSAQQGLPIAQYELGLLFELGYGVDQDFIFAEKWYYQAAVQGHPDAQYNLYILYGNSELNWSQDKVSESIIWCKRAALNGLVDAQYSMALNYLQGRGVPANEIDGLMWCYIAAENGHRMAQFRIGEIMEKNKPIYNNIDEAIKWYKKSASQGVEFAKDALKRLNQ